MESYALMAFASCHGRLRHRLRISRTFLCLRRAGDFGSTMVVDLVGVGVGLRLIGSPRNMSGTDAQRTVSEDVRDPYFFGTVASVHDKP